MAVYAIHQACTSAHLYCSTFSTSILYHMHHMHHISLVAQCFCQTHFVRLILSKWSCQSPCQTEKSLHSTSHKHHKHHMCHNNSLTSPCLLIWITVSITHTICHPNDMILLTWTLNLEPWTTWMKDAPWYMGSAYKPQTTCQSHSYSCHKEIDTCKPPMPFQTPHSTSPWTPSAWQTISMRYDVVMFITCTTCWVHNKCFKISLQKLSLKWAFYHTNLFGWVKMSLSPCKNVL